MFKRKNLVPFGSIGILPSMSVRSLLFIVTAVCVGETFKLSSRGRSSSLLQFTPSLRGSLSVVIVWCFSDKDDE